MGERRPEAGITRRKLLEGAALALALPPWATAAGLADGRDTDGNRLWYERPAADWLQALPIGNGRLGAMVFGRVGQERLQLNIDTLHGGGPYDPANPDALDALPRVRALIDQGRFKEASELADRTMMGRPKWQVPFGSAGDLLIDFPGEQGEPASYHRELDLDAAMARVRYDVGSVQVRREAFVSADAQVMAMSVQATGPVRCDFHVSYRHPGEARYGAARFDGSALQSSAAPAGPIVPEPLDASTRPASLHIAADGAQALLIQGSNFESLGIAPALRYAVRVRVVTDGQVVVDGDRLSIRGASHALLLVAGETSYRRFDDVSGDPVVAVRDRTEVAASKGLDALMADHLARHRALYRRMTLRLGKPAAGAPATDRRIRPPSDPLEPDFAVLHLNYARYLLISSSRPGGQPANLQGLWNEGNNPPWGSKYTININTEMNYWLAGPANLHECVEPLLRMVEDLAVTGARTARLQYGARGWVAHHNTDLWRATAPIDGPMWGLWPMGGAWLCLTLWDEFQYRHDDALLRRLYPLMRGAALFFLDTLVEDPEGRGLVTSPSISPENAHGAGVAICAGPAMDRQILRDLFAAVLDAQRHCGVTDAAFTESVSRARARLPADRIGAQGQLQEWLDDWDAQAPDQRHRHVSHLYGLFPSDQVNVRDTPALARAARTTLDARGDLSTGWATAWRLALWARLGDGQRALGILQGLLSTERTYPNLFDAHPPFQIDGNFGGAAGMLEMLVQSWGGEIRLLPALPAAWPDGELRGVRARGGVEVDLAWSKGRLTRAMLQGRPGAVLRVRHAGGLMTLALDAQGRAQWPRRRTARANPANRT
jgi:alpha-L-fucosidase 2